MKFKKIKKTFVLKIILHNYILYKGDPTYVAIFPVDSGMHQIFTDGGDPLPVGKSVNIRSILRYTGKIAT